MGKGRRYRTQQGRELSPEEVGRLIGTTGEEAASRSRLEDMKSIDEQERQKEEAKERRERRAHRLRKAGLPEVGQ